MKSQLSLIDLFAGCGGLSMGLEQAGFTPVFVNELNQDAMDSYLMNRLARYPWLETNRVNDVNELVQNPNIIKRALKERSIETVDLLVGGPPCQGFSGIGHRRSYSVEKKHMPSNRLYESMAELIRQLKPKIFLFENVRGILNAKWTEKGEKGEIWKDVKSTFSGISGYHFSHALVFAKYYGVPQNRPRVLGVGIRSDLPFEFRDGIADGLLPEPTGNYPNLEEVLADLIDKDYLEGPTKTYPSDIKEPTELQKYFRNDPVTKTFMGKGTAVTEHEYSRHSAKTIDKFQHMIELGTIPQSMRTKKFAQRVLQKRWKAEPNITAASLPDDYVHYKQPRSLTVREWARIQTFPDWYQFAGTRTTGGTRRAGNPREGNFDRDLPKYTQIGNAVPVLLAKAIGEHFRTILGQG